MPTGEASQRSIQMCTAFGRLLAMSAEQSYLDEDKAFRLGATVSGILDSYRQAPERWNVIIDAMQESTEDETDLHKAASELGNDIQLVMFNRLVAYSEERGD